MNQLVPSVRRKPPSRSTPFQPSHELQYGVRVAARNVTGAVCSVQCQFCRYFGREETPGSKRKRTQTIKLYTKPYRPEYFKDHNLSAHSQKWLEYEALNDQGKGAFFTALPTRSNQVLAYYEGESNGLCFTFPEAIVDEFIAKAFFDGDLEEECIPTALRAFDQARDGYYDVIIKTPLRFSLAVQHLSMTNQTSMTSPRLNGGLKSAT
ncbi:hypothetical protein PR002_g15564 [Phytophthora rubi]|uniref:Uncharacterized protein n=1 Tax=Phytophthora rubi TaxID=129364 RepID=A0A6A3L1I1_9STRA|nr:hypothetical protein PR002_g15564 [Phytophthora rubi]